MPLLRQNAPESSIICISSVAGRLGYALRTPYAAAKWGIIGFMKSLAQELEGVEGVGDVRGSGLFVGVEFITDKASKTPDSSAALRVVNALREKHVLISASGESANVLKIRPPLPFSEQNVDEFMEILRQILPSVR